jgi:hypothetical protein
MKFFNFFLWLSLLTFPNVLLAQGSTAQDTQAVQQGCRAIDVHCKCTNPDRDFTVESQKLGRANPGEPGACTTKLEIDSQAEKMPIAYCLRGESVKDPRKGESQCKATWTCKEPCNL